MVVKHKELLGNGLRPSFYINFHKEQNHGSKGQKEIEMFTAGSTQ
jgi:hypothetical protein